MYWIYLFAAGMLEIVWATALKFSEGFSRILYSLLAIVFMLVSFFLLALALKKLPVGTAYAIWTGIGTVGTFLAGIFIFHEAIGIGQGICVLLIVSGIVGLKLL